MGTKSKPKALQGVMMQDSQAMLVWDPKGNCTLVPVPNQFNAADRGVLERHVKILLEEVKRENAQLNSANGNPNAE